MSQFEIAITYGPLRLRMAEYFGIDPGDLTIEQAHEYEALMQDGVVQ